MKRADSLLHHFIRELGIEDGVRLTEIKKNWHTLFHEPLVSHMWPYTLSEGEILLAVDSPVSLQELQYYKDDIVKKFSSYGVRSVRFRLGRVSQRKKPGVESSSADYRLTDEEQAYIEETVSAVGDEELRKVIRRAITKALMKKQSR